MRYELTDYEWAAIKPFLPNKPRGVPRVNDRRVLNGIFWVLRSGAPWRDLPDNFGPYTTCYNRFLRWRRAGVWDQLMNALTFHFCPTCGSTVYWEGEGFPGFVAVAIGTFADPNFPAPTIAVWEESRHPWISLPADTPPKRVAKQG